MRKVLLVPLTLLIAAVALPTAPARAQSFNGSISGTVKDTSGGAVPGAAVTLQAPNGADQQTVISGPDGRFTFNTVPPGATVLVAGSAVFEDPDGPVAALGKFKQAIRR